jgi:hypothetical protein
LTGSLPVMAVLAIALTPTTGVTALRIDRLKPLYPRTEIAVGGRAAAAIVAPDQPELADAAQEVVRRLQETAGVTLPVLKASHLVSDSWEIDFDAFEGRNLIAVGSINTNRLLAVLWGEGYVVADSIYPGEGGYVIRTVHDPFARGMNVVVLAGSDADGVRRAVDLFFEKHVARNPGDVVLAEPITETEFARTEKRFFPPPTDPLSSKRQPQYSTMAYFRGLFGSSGLMDSDGNVLSKSEGDLTVVTGAIARLGQTFFRTGNPALPPLMKQILDRNRHLLEVVPRRVEMEAASAADAIWWDIVEELPVWTDQDRLDITNALLADALQGHERRAAHQLVKEGFVQVVDENHGTNSALNTFNAWRYFDKYYDLPETEYWMDVVRAVFAGQCASHQILEDAAGYLCYCPEDAMRYAFASRDMRFFELGIAQGHADYIAQCTVNNLGLSTGFGDSPSLVQPAVFEALAPAAWHLRDPRLAWVVQNLLPQACGLRIYQSNIPFDLTIEPREPVEWTGMRLFPVYQQPLRTGEASKEFVSAPRESAGREWFNKIVFREAWSPEAQYLLLDGAGKFGALDGYPNAPAGHRHDDVNTIANFTDEGRMWLVDHTYESRAIKDHSGLYITRDGLVSYQLHEAKLQDFAQGGDFALCRSVFEGFSGADWERTVFWRKGRHFLVIDRAVARQPGHYVVRCSFRGLGEAELRANSLRLVQQGKACDIVSDGSASLDTEEFAFPAQEEWTRWYEYAEPVATVFQQDKSARLEPGQHLSFANLIQAGSSPTELDPVSLVPVSDSSAIVDHGPDVVLYGVGNPPGDVIEASAYAIGREAALFSGLTRLGGEERPALRSSAPVSLWLDADGSAWVEGSEPASIALGASNRTLELSPGEPQAVGELGGPLQPALARILATARDQAAAYKARPSVPSGAEGLAAAEPALTLNTPVADARLLDIDGDNALEWVVVGDKGVSVFASDGTVRWTFEPGRACRVFDAADLDGDGALEIAVGCDDTRVYLLDSEGSQRWSFECKPSGTHTLPPAVDFVRIADLDADGTPEVVVGANWVHCLDASGQVKWEKYLRFARGRIAGDFKCGAVADLDGDGRQEVLALFLYTYHQALVFDAAGRIVLPSDYDNDRRFGINIDLPRCVLLADLFARGEGQQFVLGGDKYLLTYWTTGQFAGQSGGRKGGCYIALASCQPPGEHPFVYAATDMGAVIAYRPGEPRNDQWITLEAPWSYVIGERISALWAGEPKGDGAAVLLVGTKNGAVHVLDAATGALGGGTKPTGSSVVCFADSADGAFAVHAHGMVHKVRAD